MSVMCLLPFSCSLEEETRTEVEKKNYMNNAEEAKDVIAWSLSYKHFRCHVWILLIHTL